MALLKSRLSDYDALIDSETFDAEGAELQLAFPAALQPQVQKLLSDISRGRSELHLLEP